MTKYPVGFMSSTIMSEYPFVNFYFPFRKITLKGFTDEVHLVPLVIPKGRQGTPTVCTRIGRKSKNYRRDGSSGKGVYRRPE